MSLGAGDLIKMLNIYYCWARALPHAVASRVMTGVPARDKLEYGRSGPLMGISNSAGLALPLIGRAHPRLAAPVRWPMGQERQLVGGMVSWQRWPRYAPYLASGESRLHEATRFHSKERWSLLIWHRRSGCGSLGQTGGCL